MYSGLLIDTDVIIDYLRDNPQSVSYLEQIQEPVVLSSISVGELYSGVRDGREMTVMELFLKSFEIVPVTLEIAREGGLFSKRYRKSHGVSLADSIIAATALARNLKLVTLNTKHYPMFNDLTVPYTKTN